MGGKVVGFVTNMRLKRYSGHKQAECDGRGSPDRAWRYR